MRALFLLFICTCLSIGTYAQADTINASQERNGPNYKRWHPGFVVNLQGDTVRGKVRVTDFMDQYYDCQHKVSFESKTGHSYHYSPYELISFSYIEDRDTMHRVETFESVSDPLGDGHIFSKLYACGPCRVYGCTLAVIRREGMTGTAVASSLFRTEKKYVQVNRSEFYPLKAVNFKKVMKEAFASCPNILNGLEAKVYTYDNWEKMVNDYNKGVCK